ncbi:MAG: chromosome segregation protein SMC [Armatimonadota bacterium]
MQLRRLELIGFKTFVGRTELDFHPGITAIVGPNGSGKSNIFDGIRWALGEMNPRLLRGARMDDVIFAGSTGRRPHSLAQVSLTLDNGAGVLPLEFSDVTVSRKVTRGGEGEYALNGVDCRLRDIQMLFLGTGLGGRSYALIGQGEVDAVLRATPVERRQWLEEAAGLARHKRQRVEAERRLAHAQTHLERLTDVLDELEAQQQALAAQAEAATHHRAYTQELSDLEVALFADEARRLLGAVRRLADQLAREREALTVADTRAGEAAAAVEAIQAGLDEATAVLEARQQNLLEEVERLSAHTAEVQALDARMESLRARQQDTAAEEVRLAGALDRTRAEAEAIRRDADLASRERGDQARMLESAEAAMQAAVKDAEGVEAALARSRAEGIEIARTHAQTRSDLAALRARADVLRQAIDAAARKAAALDQTTARLVDEQRAAREAYAAALRRAEEAEAALARCVDSLTFAKDAFSTESEHVRAAELEEDRTRTRLGSLEEAHDQFAGLDEGVQAVLVAARAEPGRFAGLRGAVTDLLEVPSDYRAAIAAALGPRLHGVVVDARSQIDAVRAFIEQEGRGGAAVLAMDTLRPPRAGGVPTARIGADALRAADLVKVTGGLTPLAEALLGDVAVVADLTAAWQVFATGFAGRIVTRSGHALMPDGAVFLRGRAISDASPLGRGQAIAELRQMLGVVERRKSEAGARRDVAAQRARAAEVAMTAARDDRDRAVAAAAARQQERERLDDKGSRLADEQRAVAAEDRPRTEALQALLADIARLEASAGDLEAEARRADDQTADLEKDLTRATAARDAAASALTTHRMTMVRIDGHAEALRVRLTDRETTIGELDLRRSDLTAAGGQLTTELAAIGMQRERAASVCDALRAKQADGKADIERVTAERARWRDDLGSRAAAQQAALDARREAEAAVHRTEVRWAQADAELGAAAARLDQEFGITLEAAAARRLEGSREEVTRRVADVRAALAALGAVNLRAIDEHTALTERLDLLRAQTTDLRDAGDALRQAIVQINAALRAGFRKTFEEVDREFGRLFQRLFEGGEAYLELVEAEPDAEPGLEVIAQLPGKARRSLVALSGGERVLVALSLIFAMLRVHPSPFCIFDEVEAALDDANTKRFTTLLRNLAEQTQVLIITHNKGTMAASDVLYGVTMQEPGVSSLVSLRLVPASSRAEPQRETVALPAE